MNNLTLIGKARAYCEQRGARFTPLREKVYEILLGKHGPMGAYELLDSLKETESGAKPATVYRALDFLLEFGFIHRLESTNAFVACHHFGSHHPVQFLICDSCGDVAEIQSAGLKDTLDKQAKQHGFRVSKQTIEAHGLCADCQLAESSESKEHIHEC
ncbi:transcriptional repressor [Alteromonas pelagimontana]|uniref:Ferric uptake regulation protein n=1 Tax=Alteromonas pelagimontana TaxID=1858656 RepID=A0A6M4MDW1_9ALTE|nr:transcriptional repressor [Alteromonas pelagimontana]QJR81374.1 transcriptional repressor [Alteromonas pelagimontana]